MRRLILIVTILLGPALAAGGWWLACRMKGGGWSVAGSMHLVPPPSTLHPPPSTTGSVSELPKLPETDPPQGLAITLWGKRDHFPIIRKPWLVDSRLADTMLLPDEPVLGIALGNEARAYSTNQLNEHEMVVDEIGGSPILVTY